MQPSSPTDPTRRYRLVTCLTQAGLEKRDVEVPFERRLDLAAGEVRRLCDLRGPGRIVRLWMTLPLRWRGPVLRDAVLRMYWDGEATPSVECPLGDFFGASFGQPVPFVGDRLAIIGGGFVCQFEMPFAERAVLELENQARRPLRLFFFQVGYFEEARAPARLETFHAQWRRQSPTTDGQPFTALVARGRGRLAGLRVDLQNRSWWLRPPFRKMLVPHAFGLGMLEGPERLRVDGEALAGTGTEDFFLGGWYFEGGAFCAPTHGVTVRSFLSGRVSAYRFFVNDPIPFQQSLELTLDHGARNELPADYAAVAYWYQAEPHAELPGLASPEARRPASPWRNVLQPLVAGAALVALAALVCWLV